MHFSTASIPPLITALVFAALGFFTFPTKSNRGGSKGYARWCFITVCWQGSWTILFNVKDPSLAAALVHEGYFWIAFIPVTFYDFAIGFLNDDALKKRVPYLYAIAGIFALSSLTSRGLVSGMYHYPWGYYPKAGPLHPLFLCFIAVVVGHAVWLLLKTLHRNTLGDTFRSHTRVVLLAPIIYTFSAIDFLANYGIGHYPYGFVFTLLSLFLVAYAILHYQLLDIRLVLRDTAVNIVTGALLGAGVLVVTLPISTMSSMVGTSLAVISTVLVMMFAYDPIRRGIQPAIDRIVFANRFAYLEELAHLPNDMLEFTNMREMLKFLVTRLTTSGKLEQAAVYMYSPTQQAYALAIQYQNPLSATTGMVIDPQLILGQDSPLAHLLKSDNRLWVKEEVSDLGESIASAALSELNRLRAGSFFGVMREKELEGIVILGAKVTGDKFNQNDLKILRALKIRLENFLLQAMVTTQESLNMVKDSHDMKNDVNALSGRLSMKRFKIRTQEKTINAKVQKLEDSLKQGPVDNNTIIEQLDEIKSTASTTSQEQQALLPVEANALERLRNKLQNWSVYGRLIAGGFEGSQKIEPIDVSPIAKICIERWRPSADRKNVELNLKLGENLTVMGERSLIEQILDNLVDNAIKATDKGSVALTCTRVDGQIVIQVRDTGCGIPADDLPTIFKKAFYQGNGQYSLEKSTGVGLVLVGQYVKSLKGEVAVESKSGIGSVFSVSLPALEESHLAA